MACHIARIKSSPSRHFAAGNFWAERKNHCGKSLHFSEALTDARFGIIKAALQLTQKTLATAKISW
jgi:hypothetical protein